MPSPHFCTTKQAFKIHWERSHAGDFVGETWGWHFRSKDFDLNCNLWEGTHPMNRERKGSSCHICPFAHGLLKMNLQMSRWATVWKQEALRSVIIKCHLCHPCQAQWQDQAAILQTGMELRIGIRKWTLSDRISKRIPRCWKTRQPIGAIGYRCYRTWFLIEFQVKGTW